MNLLNTPSRIGKRAGRKASEDDANILQALARIKTDIDCANMQFDSIVDEILIDSYIYEIKSLHMKYQFYIKLCKERGLAAI